MSAPQISEIHARIADIRDPRKHETFDAAKAEKDAGILISNFKKESGLPPQKILDGLAYMSKLPAPVYAKKNAAMLTHAGL